MSALFNLISSSKVSVNLKNLIVLFVTFGDLLIPEFQQFQPQTPAVSNSERFVFNCLEARRHHPSLSKVILDLLISAGSIERVVVGARQTEQISVSYLAKLFLEVTPSCCDSQEELLELLLELVNSAQFQSAKSQRIQKLTITFFLIDFCLAILNERPNNQNRENEKN